MGVILLLDCIHVVYSITRVNLLLRSTFTQEIVWQSKFYSTVNRLTWRVGSTPKVILLSEE